MQFKIDNVYTDIDVKEIEMHLIYKNGNYTIKELENNQKAVLIEALEIQGATCILDDDRDAYLQSKWEDRILMEIPISWKSISRHRKEYEQLEVGSNPFVIPQDKDDYNLYGLQLTENNNFL